MQKNIIFSLVAINILMVSQAYGETDLEENDLGEITVTASPIGSHSSIEIPCQIDTVKAKEIRSSSLGEVLSNIAGVNNNSTGTQAGKPIIRGMGGNRVKILSNGNSTDFQTFGVRHLATLDPLLASKIEVVRGAQGVLYGSDALGGVVNVISPSYLSTDNNESLFKGTFISEYNSNNNEFANAIKTQSAMGKVGFNLSASQRKGDNYSTGESDTWQQGTNSDLPRFAGELPYTNFDTKSVQVGLGYTADLYNISLQHTYWQSFQNFLGHTPPPDFNAVASAGQDLMNNETQLDASLSLDEWIVKSKISLTNNRRLAATGIAYENMDSTINTPAYLDVEIDRTDMKLVLQHPEFLGFYGEVGVNGYDKKQTLHSGKLVPTAEESSIGLYVFEETSIGDVELQGGLRYDTRKVEAPLDGQNNAYFVNQGFFDASNNEQDFSAFGGSLGATYKLNNDFTIATNLSQGFRIPSIFELFAGGTHGGVQAFQIGNPNLKKESNLGLDVSLRYQKDETNANLTFYSNTIKDYIQLANTGYYRNPTTGERAEKGLPEMQNEQIDARIDGIEFSLDSKIGNSTTIRTTAEYIQGKETKNNHDLAYIPPSHISMGVTQSIGSVGRFTNNELLADVHMYKGQKVAGTFEPFSQYNSTPFGSADTSGYALFDLGYHSTINFANRDIDFSIKATNIFDRGYRDYLDTYKGYALAMGRNVKFNLSIPFGGE